MNSSGGMGNIISRLQGLKNVSGRRVMPGQELLQYPEYEEPEQDYEGIANPEAAPLPNFNNFIAPPNEPEPERGGELTTQSYDVRANTVETPQEEKPKEYPSWYHQMQDTNNEYPSWYHQMQSLSNGLNNYLSPETKPINEPTIVPETEQQGEGTGWWNKFKNEISKPYHGIDPKQIARDTQSAFSREYTPNVSPETYEQIPGLKKPQNVLEQEEQERKIKEDTQSALREKTEKALENPHTTVVYGATDEVANQPDLQSEFKKYTGINFDDEIKEKTSDYEKVLSDIEEGYNAEDSGYNEQQKRINERIINNQATDSDKFYIGLALLMPLLIGSMFGKEAGLGALGGAAKGMSDIYANRDKETLKNEELLADISSKRGDTALKKSELDLKRLSIPNEIRKNLPKDEREFLKNTNEVTWKNPYTGKEEAGWELKPNIIAYPQFITSEKEKENMNKQAEEISDATVPLKEIHKLTEDIIDISSKMENKNIISDAISSYLSGKNPGLATKLGETVDYNGRKVNSYVVLEHKIKLLVDAYRQAKGMKALTNTVQEHIEGLFRNPAASFQSYEDTIDQMLYTRELAQDRLLNNASSKGFAKEFIIKDLQPSVRKTYNKLNYAEGEKEASSLLKE